MLPLYHLFFGSLSIIVDAIIPNLVIVGILVDEESPLALDVEMVASLTDKRANMLKAASASMCRYIVAFKRSYSNKFAIFTLQFMFCLIQCKLVRDCSFLFLPNEDVRSKGFRRSSP